MKKLVFTLIAATIFTSCVSYRGYYDIGLQKVEKPENSTQQYGESKIINFKENGKTKYSYEDDIIKIVWLPLSTQFDFTLKNKTEHSIKIIWNEAAFVNQQGESERVMHAGVKYIDRNNSQPPSIIIKGAKLDDMVVPTDNVYYISGEYGGWQTKPIFPNSASTQEELNTLTKQYIGKEVKVVLPIEVQGVINEYIFTFKAQDFIPLKK